MSTSRSRATPQTATTSALPAIKIGGRGVWRVDKKQLEAYVDRLHESTQAWTRGHPLNPRDKD